MNRASVSSEGRADTESKKGKCDQAGSLAFLLAGEMGKIGAS